VPAARELYRRFAEIEARGLSPMYEEWALGVADDPELCARIDALPPAKRQVNLVFGAARLHGVPLGPWPAAREWMLSRWGELEPTVRSRTTQTNEAGRCATLLPVLADIRGPLALLEVGASAGLCLLPDRYSYRYAVGADEIAVDPPDGPSPVILRCELADADAPVGVPEVVWRTGIDLHPLDAARPDDATWLDALVWPEHDDRREQLRAAAHLAALEPPRVVAGDLVEHLEEVAADAPADATLVVFHSAVLVYLSAADRALFRARVAAIAARRPTVWIANEAPGVFPDIDERLPSGLDTRGTFLLSSDGMPRARVHPHGRRFHAV
jgi:hypothetical protein